MKTLVLATIRVCALAAFALASPFAWSAPGDGITSTAHNFSGLGAPATGLCTFCHTPHRGQGNQLVWNHTLSTNTFSWSDATTTAGTNYPSMGGDTYNGPTVKCLSCHDGSVAIGDIGWWNGAVPGAPIPDGSTVPANRQVGNGGSMDGNHPVGMPFPFGNAVSTYNGSSTGAGITLADWKADPQTLGIKLYNDNAGTISRGAIAGQTGIECGSCHDPHNGAGVTGPWLLYGDLGGAGANYICNKCHSKE